MLDLSRSQLDRLTPTKDRVLIKCDAIDSREHKAGLLYMPGENADDKRARKEFYRTGIIVKVGPGDPRPSGPRPSGGRIPMTVRSGDRVVYDHSSAHEMKCDGELYCLIPEQQWVAVRI